MNGNNKYILIHFGREPCALISSQTSGQSSSASGGICSSHEKTNARTICFEIAWYAQRRLYQRVPHKNLVIKPRAGDVVLLEDILQPVHTFGSSVCIHHIFETQAEYLFCDPAVLSVPAQVATCHRELHEQHARAHSAVDPPLPGRRFDLFCG